MAKNKTSLRVGIISDPHLGFLGHINPNYYGLGQEPFGVQDKWYEYVLRYFKYRGVDVIVIPGDMANACAYGDKTKTSADYAVEEIIRSGKIFREVFKNTNTQIFCIYGNHDNFCQNREFLNGGDQNIWQEAYGEPYAHTVVKNIKGFNFVGGHWGYEQEAKPYLDKLTKETPNKPVFYVQHPAIKHTTCDSFTCGQLFDTGRELVKDYENVIALFGHTHSPITSELTIWQSKKPEDPKCTVISCSTLNYGDSTGDLVRGENLMTKHALYLTVSGDNQVNVERLSFYTPEMLDLANGRKTKQKFKKCVRSCGKDWSFTVGGEKVYDAEERKQKATAPEFPKGATAGLCRSNTEVLVCFPSAIPLDCDDNILHSYYVEAIDEETNEVVSYGQISTEFHVDHSSDYLSPYYQVLIRHLQPDTNYLFKVYARDCFGNMSTNPIIHRGKTMAEKFERLK